MTYYEWTAEQIAALVPGCTVEAFGERREVGDAMVAPWSGRMLVETKLPSKEFWLSDCDPATIEPPTAETLTRMAVEAFGEEAYVITGSQTAPVHVCGPASQPPNNIATFYSRPRDPGFAARECARYLAGRRR